MKWPGRDIHTLSGAYAVDALGEVERKRFERHQASCAACQREVRGLQEAASRFAVAVSARPPARMRARVLEAVASDKPTTADGDSRPGRAQRAGARLRRAWKPDWAPRVAMPVAAACLALAVVFVVLFAIAQDRLDSSRSQEDAIADVLSTPGAQTISRKTSIGGVVTVDVASASRELVVTTDGMPMLPASEAYQVWVRGPTGRAASDGLLTSIADHRTAPVLAAGLVRGDMMTVTVEPAGGTSRPTTRPIVDIPVPA